MRKRKYAAVSREVPEITKNNQSKNTLNPETAETFSEEIESRVIKKLS